MVMLYSGFPKRLLIKVKGSYLEFVIRWSACKDYSLAVESRINDAVTMASKLVTGGTRKTEIKDNLYEENLYFYT